MVKTVVKAAAARGGSPASKPPVAAGASSKGGLFASLLDELTAATQRDVERIVKDAGLGAKAAARVRVFKEHADGKKAEAKKARIEAVETLEEAAAAVNTKLSNWSSTCAGAKAKLEAYESELKRDADALAKHVGAEMGRINAAFGRDMDKAFT